MLSGFFRGLSWLFLRPKLVWIGVAVPVLLLVVTARLFQSDFGVRSSGFALQLFGFFAAYLGLSGVVKELVGRGPVVTISRWIAVWWSERPLSRRDVVVRPSGAGSAVLFGSATVATTTDPKATLKTRVEQLEKSVEGLRDAYARQKNVVEKRLGELSARVDDEAAARAAGDEGLSKRIQAAFVEGIGWDVLGIWFFVLSSFVGSFAREIDSVLGAR